MNVKRTLIILGAVIVILVVLGGYAFYAFTPHAITTTLQGSDFQQTTTTHGAPCVFGNGFSC